MKKLPKLNLLQIIGLIIGIGGFVMCIVKAVDTGTAELPQWLFCTGAGFAICSVGSTDSKKK